MFLCDGLKEEKEELNPPFRKFLDGDVDAYSDQSWAFVVCGSAV